MLATWLTRAAGIRHPIIQGGMGPYATDRLCAAAANAGGLGVVSLMGMAVQHCEVTPVDPVPVFGEGTTEEYVERSLTGVAREIATRAGVFGVNCPVPVEFADPARRLLEAVFATRDAHADVRERLRVVITSAGDPVPWRDLVRGSDVLWFHVVPSVAHVARAEAAGVDAVIASGHEAGGHVSWHPVHTMVLVPGVIERTELPVIAAGGICDGRTLAAALALGAQGVQMGTRFLATRDCDFRDLWKRRVVESSDRDTLVTRGLFGPMRVLRNRIAERIAARAAERAALDPSAAGPDPEILALEREGLARLLDGDDPEEALMLGGEVAGRITDLPTVDELMERIVRDAERILRDLPGRVVPDGGG